MKKNLKDSFESSLLNPKREISFKKSYISSSSSDFSSFFEKREEKIEKNEIFPEKRPISSKTDDKIAQFSSALSLHKARNSFENTKDLPRDKESFNKRKSLKEINKGQYLSSKNTNLLALFEKNSYYLPQSKRRDEKLKEASEDFLKKSENLHENMNSYTNNINLQRKWRETQEKSMEKVGKIVNQAKKLRNTYEFYEENVNHSQFTPREEDFYEKNKKKNINKTSNFIDEIQPLRKKPSSNASLAEKLKKEILLMNEQDFVKKTYNLHGFNNNSKNGKDNRKTEENWSFVGTLSSEEDEEKSFHKKHLQRKSLNPGYLENNSKNLTGNMNNNCNKHSNNTMKTFEKKDIEKIYKEYKSRKI